MDLALWIAAGLLAFVFLGAGVFKLARSKEQLLASGQGWVEDFDPRVIKLIGSLEVLGAVGVVLPPLVGTYEVMVPVAAVGLMVLMVGAGATHLRRNEMPNAAVNVVLLLLAAFVAWGRLGPHAF